MIVTFCSQLACVQCTATAPALSAGGVDNDFMRKALATADEDWDF